MALRTCASFSFRLIPYCGVRFSTRFDSNAPPEHADFNEGNSQRHESSVVSESALSGNKNEFNHDGPEQDESFEEIYNALRVECKNIPSRTRILSSVKYLKELGFSKDVILESVVVCAYPRYKIQEGLKKMYENELKLNKAGLTRGFTNDITNDFKTGTHLRDKRLQLCLYYMEEPYNFRKLCYLVRYSRDRYD